MELKEVLGAVIEERGYSFGEAWQWDKEALGVVIPVVKKSKKGKPFKRSYVTIEEVSEKVKITDTGKINSMKIENNSGEAVFLRGGNMLKGQTQTRAVQFGIILLPKEEIKEEDIPGTSRRTGYPYPSGTPVSEKQGIEEVPVRCVYQSRGITKGSSANLVEEAYVDNAVYGYMSEGQDVTWKNIKSVSRAFAANVGKYDYEFKTEADDLEGHYKEMNKMGKFKDEVLDKIKNSPIAKGQVGVVIFTEKGVTGFEFFDDPKSWEAIHSRVMVSHINELIKKQEKGHLWEFNVEKAIPSVKEYVAKIFSNGVESEKKVGGKGWATYLIDNKKIMTEYTLMGDIPSGKPSKFKVIADGARKDKVEDEIIHVISTRK